jgi:uncharacterized membrane protein YeaQ/YmgE (transglycosylase-associated protein family)
MSILIALVIGGLAGWIASMIVNRNEQMGIVLNIVVGIAGAFLANLLLEPLLGLEASLTTLSLSTFLMNILGAVALLVIVNLFTRKSIR